MSSAADRIGNLADLLAGAAAKFGARTALITPDGSRSWADLDAAVETGAGALAELDLPPGARVVLGLPTGPEIVTALFAVARAGLVAVPVGPGRAPFSTVIERVGAALVIAGRAPGNAPAGTQRDAATDAVDGSGGPDPTGPERPVRWETARVAGWWTAAAPTGRRPIAGAGEDLVQLARAASSDRPVMLSHRAILGAVAGIVAAPGSKLRAEDRVVQVLPLYHPAGWISAFLPLTAVGAAAVLPELPAGRGGWIEAVLATVREQRVTVIPGAPGLYRRLRTVAGVERALATVRLMTSGASPLDREDFAAVRALTGISVREGYGVSEAAAVVASSLMTAAARPGSVGLPFAGVEIRIIEDTDEDEVGPDAAASDGSASDGLGPDQAASDGSGPDEPGAAASADPTATNPDRPQSGPDAPGPDAAAKVPGPGAAENAAPVDVRATGPDPDPGPGSGPDPRPGPGLTGIGEVGPIAVRGATLFSGYWPDGSGGPGPDGWFVTGDVGYLDDFGELHLVDRAAEALVVAGFTVYPREVEDVLTTHPYIRDAAVVGVPSRLGEIMLAVLVAQRGTHPTPADVDEFVAQRLPPFKRPTRYRLIDRLPRSEVGRIDREAVRRDYLADPDPEPGPVRLTPGPAGRTESRGAVGRPTRSGPTAAVDEELF